MGCIKQLKSLIGRHGEGNRESDNKFDCTGLEASSDVKSAIAVAPKLAVVQRSEKARSDMKADTMTNLAEKDRLSILTDRSVDSQESDFGWLRLAQKRESTLKAQLAAIGTEADSLLARKKTLMHRLEHIEAAEDAVAQVHDDLNENWDSPKPLHTAARQVQHRSLQLEQSLSLPKHASSHRSTGPVMSDTGGPKLSPALHKYKEQQLSGQYVKICKSAGSSDCRVVYRPPSQRYRHVTDTAPLAAKIIRPHPFATPPPPGMGGMVGHSPTGTRYIGPDDIVPKEVWPPPPRRSAGRQSLLSSLALAAQPAEPPGA